MAVGSKSPAFKHFDGPCCQKTWEVPQDYAMEYDELNMTAPAGPPRSSPTSVDPTHWGNHVTCPHCGKLARSNIYGFGGKPHHTRFRLLLADLVPLLTPNRHHL